MGDIGENPNDSDVLRVFLEGLVSKLSLAKKVGSAQVRRCLDGHSVYRRIQAYTDSTCIRAVARRVGSKKAIFWRVYRFLVSKDSLGKR